MRFRSIGFLCLALLVGLVGGVGSAKAQTEDRPETLNKEFEAAAEEYVVPEELLSAMGYTNTRLEMPPPEASDYEKGELEGRGNYGIMGLVENPSTNTLGKASELTGIPKESLKTDREANIRGGAALLAEIQGSEKPEDLNGWYKAVAEYGDGPLYANQVFEALQKGFSVEVSTGERVTLDPQPQAEPQELSTPQASADYPRANFYGANSNNYSAANRPISQPINKIVIHVTQGSFSSAINWFKDPRAGVSAHYTVRSRDGFIGQSLREKDIGYHAGNWNYNQTSIGIEHEGYVSNPAWYTDAMYRSSARLSAYLAKKYNIPIDRRHIVGHSEVPRATHTDPGRYWDWNKYMRYVRQYAGSGSGTGGTPRPKPGIGTTKQLTYSSGTWYLKNSLSGGKANTVFRYGRSGDRPLMGDWNGDGTKTPGLYRNGTFYLKNANKGGKADRVFSYGRRGDRPVVGDWNGDGRDTVGIRRGDQWMLRNANSGGKANLKFNYGKASDRPVVGDWNGDRRDTVGARRGDRWMLRNANSGGRANVVFNYGRGGDKPVVGDWNNNRRDTVGVVRGNRWLLRNSNSGGKANVKFIYGGANHTPLVWKYRR